MESVVRKDEKKKSVIKVGNTDIEVRGSFKFIDEYEAWVKKCQGIGRKKLLSEGRRIRKPREGKKVGQIDTKSGQLHPANLYLQLKEHVTSGYRRDRSPNKGSTGAFTLLDDIEEFMEEFKEDKILLVSHVKKLQEFQEAIEGFEEATSTLNPRNTVFNFPAKSDADGNAIGKEKDQVYGHYANEWYNKKYGKKAPPTWYSDTPNTANPPLAQALFGRGDLIKVGLKDILKIALAESNKAIENMHLQVNLPSKLAIFPPVRKHVLGLLKRKALFKENGIPKLAEMANTFSGMKFTLDNKKTSKEALSKIAGIEPPAGQIKTFSLKPFQATAMSSLIVAVIGKGKSKKLAWGEHLNLKGLKVPQDDIQKSWHEYLWS